MIPPFKVPRTFTKLIRQCYAAVPCDWGDAKGYINAFHDTRVVRDLYELWRHLHAKAANLAHQTQYFSCHDEDNLAEGDMKFWEREVCTILNCKFAGNATFEWFEQNEQGHIEKTNGFPWLPTPNFTAETKRLLSQPALYTLFEMPQYDLSEVAKIVKMVNYDPIEHLVAKFDYAPERAGEYRMFAPLEPMMKDPSSDFVPYTSPSLAV